MDYDYSKLKGKIVEFYETHTAFAKAMKMGRVSLYRKLNNQSEWTQDEMERAMSLLKIPRSSVRAYFFNHKV